MFSLAACHAVPTPQELSLERGDKDTSLSWSTPFGEGGAAIPPQSEETAGGSSSNTFSRLVAVVFPPDGRDVLFVGEAEPGKPPLDTQELLDAFVLAFRARRVGQSPGVTIDPTAEQLARSIVENDRMDVRYFGGLDGTLFGWVAFEADRLMKCLSLGRDNITKKPFGCRVPGYRNEMDLLQAIGDKSERSWHRFWIEMLESRVNISQSGRVYMPDIRLGIKTEYMVPRGGKLESGNCPPDPAAKAFADHMTQSYIAYAEEFPVYRKLWTFAQLTSVAEAIQPPKKTSANSAEQPPPLDLQWVMNDCPITPFKTPTLTPATIISHTNKTQRGNVISTLTLKLSGGVTLRPQNTTRMADRQADALERAVFAKPSDLRGREWTASLPSGEYRVVSRRLAPRELRLWQTDLRVGPVAVVRQYAAPNTASPASFGRRWQIQQPRLRVSTTTVKLESGRSVSEAVHLEDAQGKLTVLDQHATLTMPGEGPTQGFSTRDDAKNLFCYKNLWILTEGDVKFVSNKQGPDKFRIPSAGRVSCFSPDKPHNVLFSKTERDSVVYTYERDKLAKLSDDKGNSIRLTHDAQGRCTKLSGSDGKEINYSYDNNGNLIAASDGKENSITYRNNPATGEPEAMRAGFDNLPATARRRNVPEQPGKTEITRTASTTPQEPAIPPMARSETRPAISQTVRPGRGRVTAVNIEQTQEGFLLMNGKREPDNEQLLILSRMVNRNKDEQSIEKFRRKFDAQPGDEVILTAPADVVDLIALAGKRAGLQINVATDLSTAQKNKASQLHVKTSPWTLVFKDTVSKSFYEKYEHLEKNGGSPDNLVIAVGDNNVDYQAHLMKAAEKGFFQDKVVFLAACGKPGMVKWVEEFVKTSGARGVFRFAEQQGQKELPEFVDEFRKQYKNLHDAHPESPTSPADPIQMFFRALEETIKALPKRPEMQDVNPEVIEKFRLILHQLSKLRSLEPSRFIAAAPPGFIELTRDGIKNENKQPLAVILHHYA